MKQMESQLTNIQSFLSQRQLDNLPSQPKPNPKKEDVNVVMTRSKRIQEDFEEKEGLFQKLQMTSLLRRTKHLRKLWVSTDGNLMPKKVGGEKKEILTSPQISLPFPHKGKNDQQDYAI